MNGSQKIQPTHRSRQAVVYIRQSDPKQVRQNRESGHNQRALRERVLELGWQKNQIALMDEDQGRSAKHTAGRDAFQKLVADVGLRKVGIIVGYEVSRLSRNCADWYRLLELCALFDTLIADADGVYNPRDFNDRLLLGLKGTLSEAELHSIRLRLDAGRLSKAGRGELVQHLPTGLLRDANGVAQFDPDQSVQDRIRLVFAKFRELGSAQKVLRYMGTHGLKLPRRQTSGLYAGTVLWKEPNSAMLLSLLKNPAYAGAFAYGRRIADPTRQIPGRPATGKIRQPPDRWLALVKDVYPAYITWEEHERILATIEENRQKMAERLTRKQAIRGGAALLTGLVRCGRCGHAMQVAYKDNRFQYICRIASSHYSKTNCQYLTGAPIDEAVVQEFFRVLQPAEIDALERVNAKQAEHQRELETPPGTGGPAAGVRGEARRATVRQRGPREPADRLDPGEEVGRSPVGARAVEDPAGRTEGPEPATGRDPGGVASGLRRRRSPLAGVMGPTPGRRPQDVAPDAGGGRQSQSRRDRRGSDPDRVAWRPRRVSDRSACQSPVPRHGPGTKRSGTDSERGRRGPRRRHDRRGSQSGRLPAVPRRGLHPSDRFSRT